MEICRRCDPAILELADYLIRQEVDREPKRLRAEDGKAPGLVELHRYPTQVEAAAGIAQTCSELVAEGIVQPGEILILLRSDRNGVFSSVIQSAVQDRELPVHVDVGGPGPFGSTGGRQLLSLLRLAVDKADSLTLRALIKVDDNRMGDAAIAKIEAAALSRNARFGDLVHQNLAEDVVDTVASRLRTYVATLFEEIAELAETLNVAELEPDLRPAAFGQRLAELQIPDRVRTRDEEDFRVGLRSITGAAIGLEATSIEEVIRALGSSKENEEQDIDPNAINILSMHKAKGPGALTVFVVAVEEEYMPGRAESQLQIDEERRLLYVSLTRARHRLYLSYCARRTGRQTHTGATSGTTPRRLTSFLRDGPLTPISGN